MGFMLPCSPRFGKINWVRPHGIVASSGAMLGKVILALHAFRRILPTLDLGKLSTNSTWRGRL